MSPRRQVVSATHFPVRDEWLSQTSEEILEPDLPIIDSHHHIWDRPNWRYMIDDIAQDLASGHNIIATVFVQCHSMHRANGPEEMAPVGETEFVNGIAAIGASGLYGKQRLCAGIVGHANLTLGEAVKPILEAHIQAGGGRFRGIRHITVWDDDDRLINKSYSVKKELLADPNFRAGFAELEKLDLSFDAWLYHPQIDDLTDLAQNFPGTTIVLDHCGGPLGLGEYAKASANVFASWRKSIEKIAACANVKVKLGGLGMRINGYNFHEKHLPPTSDELVKAWFPYFDTCIQAFGPDRCMFESNFPVDKGSYSYSTYWNACKKLTNDLNVEDREYLFSKTAAKVYRVDLG